MVRLRRIEDELIRHERDVATVRAQLEGIYERERLSRVWKMVAAHWDFGVINDLIDRHNRWYPIEARLPMDPRTGDFATRDGTSYLRWPLGPEWVLSRAP